MTDNYPPRHGTRHVIRILLLRRETDAILAEAKAAGMKPADYIRKLVTEHLVAKGAIKPLGSGLSNDDLP